MERMKEIEIFGIPALFTEKRIDHDAVYPGMYRYELETVNNGPKRVSDTASGTFLGTVLTPVPNDTFAQPQSEREAVLTDREPSQAMGAICENRRG